MVVEGKKYVSKKGFYFKRNVNTPTVLFAPTNLMFSPNLCYFNLQSVHFLSEIISLPLRKAYSLFHIAWSQLERMYAIISAQPRCGVIYRSTQKF